MGGYCLGPSGEVSRSSSDLIENPSRSRMPMSTSFESLLRSDTVTRVCKGLTVNPMRARTSGCYQGHPPGLRYRGIESLAGDSPRKGRKRLLVRLAGAGSTCRSRFFRLIRTTSGSFVMCFLFSPLVVAPSILVTNPLSEVFMRVNSSLNAGATEVGWTWG